MATDYEGFYALCAARRSRRRFQEQPLDPDLIERIKRIALTSPYASGRKNWEVMVVTDAGVRAAMGQAVARRTASIGAGVKPGYAEEFAAYAAQFTGFAAAPALFIPTFRAAPTLALMGPDPDGAIARWERDTYVKSISCATMLILLAAESLGLAACCMTGPLLAEDELGPLIGIRNSRTIAAIIPVGHRIEED